MKMKKGLGIFAVLLAFSVTACNLVPQTSESKKEEESSEVSNSSSQQQAIKITAAGGKKTLEIGEEVQLSADVDGVTWSTANAEVATVSDAGLVTAIAPGSAAIKAVKEGYKDGSISITVTKPAAPHPAEPTWPEECPELIDTTDWVAGTPVKNSYGKDYTPLTAADGSVGVKMALADYDPESAGAIDSDGKITPQNESSAYVTFKLKAPKAGVYQMILKASVSSSGDEHPFAGESSRGFDVIVNNYDDQDNVYGSRLFSDANLDYTEKRAFIFALVQLNGPEYEDEISFRNPYYRLKFDINGDIVFAENK